MCVVDLIGYRRHGHSEVDDPDDHAAHPLSQDQGPSAALRDLCRSVGHRSAAVCREVPGRARCRAEGRQEHDQEAGHAAVAQLLGAVSWRPVQPGRRSRYRPSCEQSCSDITDGLTKYPAGLPHPSQGAEAARAAPRDGLRQASARLRHGRGAGLRFAGAARHSDPPERTGQPPRHLQSAALGADRHRGREGIRAAVSSRARSGARRDLQLGALRSRGHGL